MSRARGVGRLASDPLCYDPPVSAEESIKRVIAGVRSADDDATEDLWKRYCRRLVEHARGRLPGFAKREFDEEDVALSAFHSFCRGVQNDRFPDLGDPDGLWALLMVITARKASRRLRAQKAEKRGGGAVRGESVLGYGGDDAGLDRIIGREPTPEFVAQMHEESEHLLGFLDDPMLRRIALLKIEGKTNAEVAQVLDYTHRTVERRLALIRRLWIERSE